VIEWRFAFLAARSQASVKKTSAPRISDVNSGQVEIPRRYHQYSPIIVSTVQAEKEKRIQGEGRKLQRRAGKR
jgi:hypothetical protein